MGPINDDCPCHSKTTQKHQWRKQPFDCPVFRSPIDAHVRRMCIARMRACYCLHLTACGVSYIHV